MTLREFKKKHRYTIQDMADLFHVPHQTISMWLHRKGDVIQVKGRSGSRYLQETKILARENDG